MTQTALDWRLEGFYARYVDASGKCRAMVRVQDPFGLPEIVQPGAERVKVP